VDWSDVLYSALHHINGQVQLCYLSEGEMAQEKERLGDAVGQWLSNVLCPRYAKGHARLQRFTYI